MSKYRSKRTTVDGIAFHSKKEAARYGELKMLEKAGMISDLILQPSFEIAPGFRYNGKKERARKYVADFQYTVSGRTVVEDVKSAATKKIPLYRLKRHLFLIQYADRYEFKET